MKTQKLETIPQYEGWTNKPTWAVRLWLDNDEETQRFTQHLIRHAYGDAYKLSKSLQEYSETLMDKPLSTPDMACDLLIWALAHVNWMELAETYIEEYEADQKEEA